MRQEQQIDQLNSIVKAGIGISKIDGVGVIALTNIRKGAKIYADKIPEVYSVPYGSFKKLFPHIREEILKRWPSVINGSKFIWPDARLLSFMNHMDSPWDNYDPLTDTAKCDILKGQEITENYMLMPNFEKVWPLDKNQWLLATNVEKPKSLMSLIVACLARFRTKNSVLN